MPRVLRVYFALFLGICALFLSYIPEVGRDTTAPLTQRALLAVGYAFAVYFYIGVYAGLLRRLQKVFGVTLKLST